MPYTFNGRGTSHYGHRHPAEDGSYFTTVWVTALRVFTEHADISKREVIVPIAGCFGISASDLETAWHERRFSPTVDAFIKNGHKAGVRGVPAMGWPNRRAIVGLMPPTELVLRPRNEAPERVRE